MTTAEALQMILTAQGRTVRSGQAAAADLIDSGIQHVAACCPTGIGKSTLAIAASVAAGGGTIAIHSNGLVAQYMAEAPEWEAATGVKIAALIGKGHYWCPAASPDLAGLTPAQQVHVRTTGTFVGAGLEQARYKAHTVLSLGAPADEEEGDDKAKSPCNECQLKGTGCPLWAAREAAAEADIVITNATMLGVALGSAPATWMQGVLKPLIVLDEAHADAEPIAAVLGAQITIRDERATGGLSEALDVVFDWAADDDHRQVRKARRFLSVMKAAKAEGRRVQYNLSDDKVVLTVPADLVEAFATRQVVAMSATLSERNVQDLGLSADLVSFAGLDVSASTVTLDMQAPGWVWGKADPQGHGEWAAHVAQTLTDAFREGGRTLGLFVSKDDLHAVVAQLPADVRSAALHYYSGVDRVKTLETYKAAPSKHLIVGCVSGAGTGVNLPEDLLRRVVISRVPQNPPRSADRAKWAEDTRAAVVQSVGRGHRCDGDWANITIVGGFGARKDVETSLRDLGWGV